MENDRGREWWFIWNPEKAEANRLKHGVSFDEAETIFDDGNVLTIFDAEHSTEEDRFRSVGFSARGRLLVVVHMERWGKIRLISARKATRTEAKHYARRNQSRKPRA